MRNTKNDQVRLAQQQQACEAMTPWKESDKEKIRHAPMNEQLEKTRILAIDISRRIDQIKVQLLGSVPSPATPAMEIPEPLEGGLLESISFTNTILELVSKEIALVQGVLGER